MRVIPEPSLQERTSLRLGGKALAEVWMDEDQDWERLPDLLQHYGGKPLILGHGSNVLASDTDLPVVVIRQPRAPSEFSRHSDGRGEALVQGGQTLAGLLVECRRRGLSGLEGLIGIPGTIGGAVAMNAGSYGCSFGERLRGVEVWTAEHGLFWIEAEQLRTGYRFFDPGLGKRFWAATRVKLDLQAGRPETMQSRMREVYCRKKATQPLLAPTCGCVFKNPDPSVSAGRLLDSCGMKGFRVGEMGFSERHANFLINYGQGRSADALELIAIARERCREYSGFELELEVKCLQA